MTRRSCDPASITTAATIGSRCSPSRSRSICSIHGPLRFRKRPIGAGSATKSPIGRVAEEVEKRFPGRWPGAFEIGARGPRFWDDTASNPTAAIVRSDYLLGESHFNKELFEVGLWTVDDTVPSSDPRI